MFLTISGLVPNTSYDTRFFSSDHFTITDAEDVYAHVQTTTFSPLANTSGTAVNITYDRTQVPLTDLERSVVGTFTTGEEGYLSFQISTATTENENLYVFTRLNGLEINGVPEPTTLLLLGIGLIGLAGLSRKKFFK
jgi:hypothetical protein